MLRALTTAVLVLGASVACDAPTDEDTTGAIAQGDAIADESAAVVTNLPSFYVAYGPSAEDIRTLHTRWQEATAECMRSFGFADYVPIPAPKGPFIRVDHDARPREDIALSGFLPNQAAYTARTPEEDAIDARIDSDASFRQALVGDESTVDAGCAGQARVAVYGADNEFATAAAVLDNLDSDVAGRVWSTPAYLQVESEWVSCMADRGFNFPSRLALFDAEWSAHRPGEEEVSTALADFDCRGAIQFAQRYVDLYAIEFATVSDYQAAQLQELSRQLEAFVQGQ